MIIVPEIVEYEQEPGPALVPDVIDRNPTREEMLAECDGDSMMLTSFKRNGIDVDDIAVALKELMGATDTKVFCSEATGGQPVYSDPLAAWGPREKAIDIALRVHGGYAPERSLVAVKGRIQHHHDTREIEQRMANVVERIKQAAKP